MKLTNEEPTKDKNNEDRNTEIKKRINIKTKQ